MLNEVLLSAIELGIFEKLGKKTTRNFLDQVLSIGASWDCNSGEILMDLTEEFKICYCCREYDKPLTDGLCADCAD